jgi:hypothetical protein
MNRRLALTPAIGLFTGLSMVSFGAVSMWLSGVHGSPANAKNACSTKTTAAHGTVTNGIAAHTAARLAYARHVAHLPVLLDASAQVISAGSASSPASKTSSPTPDPTPPATTNPSPGGNATPSPGGGDPNPTPNSTPSKRPRSAPSISPGGTNAKPPPTISPSPTSTPTPTSTATPPPSGTLCLSVQTLGGSNTVKANHKVQFAILVWITKGKDGTAKLTLSTSPKDITPTFTICQPSGKPTCSVSGLKAGQHIQVQAELTVPKDRAGKSVTLDVAGTSHQATNSASASDTIQVKSKTPHNSPTPTPTPTTGGGGNTLPTGTGGGVPPGNSFPGAGPTPGNLGSAFPPVSPSPNVSPTTPRQHKQQPVKAIDLSAGLPLDVRLIGGQVIGLAILAAAVTIAVARLSLRRQPPRHSDEGSGSSSSS